MGFSLYKKCSHVFIILRYGYSKYHRGKISSLKFFPLENCQFMKSLPLKSKVVCISLQDSRLRNLSKKYDEEITDVWCCHKLYFIQALVTVDCGFQFGTTYGH